MPGHGRLLDQLEAGPARHEQDPVVERQLAREQPAADQLVERVVPPDVLAQRDQLPGRRRTAPDAWRPPVAPNTAWPSRSRAGSASSVSACTTGPSGIGAQRTSTWSSDALPQIPHDAVATKLRDADRRRVQVARQPDDHLVVGLGVGRRDPRPRPPARRRGPAISPSVSRNPVASSASWPGVRIVTATSMGAWPGPAARIAIGSSPASRSSRSSAAPARHAVTRTRVAWRSRAGCVQGSTGRAVSRWTSARNPSRVCGEPLGPLQAGHVRGRRRRSAARPGRAATRRSAFSLVARSSTGRRSRAAARAARGGASRPAGRAGSGRRTPSPGRRCRRPSAGRARAPAGGPGRPAARSRRPRSRRRGRPRPPSPSPPRGPRIARTRPPPRACSRASEPAEPAAHPDEARDPVRELERGVDDDQPGPRAAHEDRPLEARRVHDREQVRAVGERDVLHLGPAEAAQVVADDAVASGERVPLRVPLARVGDARVGEHDAAPLAGPLGPQPAAGHVDEPLERLVVMRRPPGPGTPRARSAAGSGSMTSPGGSRRR